MTHFGGGTGLSSRILTYSGSTFAIASRFFVYQSLTLVWMCLRTVALGFAGAAPPPPAAGLASLFESPLSSELTGVF